MIQDTRTHKIHQEILLEQVTLEPINLIWVLLDTMNHFSYFKDFSSVFSIQHFYCVLGYSSLCIYPTCACWAYRHVDCLLSDLGSFQPLFPWTFFLLYLSLLYSHYQSIFRCAWWCPTGLLDSVNFSSFFFFSFFFRLQISSV